MVTSKAIITAAAAALAVQLPPPILWMVATSGAVVGLALATKRDNRFWDYAVFCSVIMLSATGGHYIGPELSAKWGPFATTAVLSLFFHPLFNWGVRILPVFLDWAAHQRMKRHDPPSNS